MRFVPLSVRYIVNVYLFGLIFFTFFRCVLFLGNASEIQTLSAPWSEIGISLFMGLRFDTVVSGYMLALPAVILLFAEVGRVLNRGVLLFCHWFICIVYSIGMFICAADIPFFQNYNNRLNVTILNWTDSPLFMLKMVLQDNKFLGFLLLFAVLCVVMIILFTRVYKKFKGRIPAAVADPAWKPRLSRLGIGLVFLGLMLLGIRGRTDEKSPIVVGTAYFCNDNLPNQAGLNPIFTLMWSWTDGWKDENKKLELANDTVSVRYARHSFGLVDDGKMSISRVENTGLPEQHYNVVVVLMESMSAWYMQRYGNELGLTPNLDSLAQHSLCFDNFYSAGLHTFNGIFSTLYGFPALMARHTMEGALIPSYTGMPWFFRQRQYQSIYFTTHDDQFDNVGGFLSANNFATIISKKDYPSEKVKSTLGVPDHDMFDFALPRLSKMAATGKPFFATIMTTSNHNPYVIPEGIPFTAKHTDVRGGCVEYADWAIGHLMQEASKLPWYNKTIFVFLGDHGVGDGPVYGAMSYSYSHIPCIIYAPVGRNTPRVIQAPGGQIDLFPTIAGMLGGSYTNNTMGVDLFRHTRDWIAFSQDDKVCVADTSRLYIWQKNGPEQMFNIRSREDILAPHRILADSLRNYAFNMIQCAQWLRSNGKTGPDKERNR